MGSAIVPIPARSSGGQSRRLAQASDLVTGSVATSVARAW